VTDQFLILTILSPTKKPPVFYGHQSQPGSGKNIKSLQEMEPRLHTAVTSRGLSYSSVLYRWTVCHMTAKVGYLLFEIHSTSKGTYTIRYA